ncbi:hypothetical protein CBR_g50406 [Chara braunii]|uniref:UMP-CMP kinase n=1 Tax=Chara braunii TaxID=69332 RepID=A0A388M6K4_CHABU|nr:hypothetical protein CBR_g50406 [Chara braunii]|eukprot:GBG90227.1 hypothetical protein CBR_g50406 [Chara braunii]
MITRASSIQKNVVDEKFLQMEFADGDLAGGKNLVYESRERFGENVRKFCEHFVQVGGTVLMLGRPQAGAVWEVVSSGRRANDENLHSTFDDAAPFNDGDSDKQSQSKRFHIPQPRSLLAPEDMASHRTINVEADNFSGNGGKVMQLAPGDPLSAHASPSTTKSIGFIWRSLASVEAVLAGDVDTCRDEGGGDTWTVHAIPCSCVIDTSSRGASRSAAADFCCSLLQVYPSSEVDITMESEGQVNGTFVYEGASAAAYEMREKPTVIFVLGGPGSGKGTQCARIVENYGFVHLSAGDLLRAEVASGSEHGVMLQNMMKEGKIVPAEVTVGLLQAAMAKSGKNKFLIDGFPRDEDNRLTFERVTGIIPEFVLFFDCPEDVMEKRLLNRGEGRVDDNVETIRKRFKVFSCQSVPVVDYYERLAKVRKVKSTYPPDMVFTNIKPYFTKFLEADVLDATRKLVKAIDNGDSLTYRKFVDEKLTAYEPEAQGHLVEGLPFHLLWLDTVDQNTQEDKRVISRICSPWVRLLGENAAIVGYARLFQAAKGPVVSTSNETRVWERRKSEDGAFEWKLVHLHRTTAPMWDT